MARPWSREEVAYLRDHRRDGSAAIAAKLGRSQQAVKNKASELGLSLLPAAHDRGELCPACAMREVDRSTVAGRNGLCKVCYTYRQTERARQRAAEIRAQRDYDAARKDLERARKGK